MPSKKGLLKSLWYLNLTVVLLFWFKEALPLFTADLASITLAFARLFGLLSVVFVLTQFLLIGRIMWIERVWGQDKIVKIHHKVGRYVLYFILLHGTFVAWSYSMTSGYGFFKQYLDFFANYSDTLNSFVAACLFIVVALLSIFFARLKLKYEVWYFIHLLVYAAILLAWGHQLKLGGTLQNPIFSTYWIALYVFVAVNFGYHRFVRILWSFNSHRFFVSRVVPEVGSATSIYIGGKDMENFKKKSGQFFILRFLDWNRYWQAHPFSLSWNALNKEIRVTVKDSGDFTHEIHGLKRGTPVLVDGPLGGFTIKDDTKSKLLFIAGGIGITPINALFGANSSSRDCVLLYSAKMRAELTLKDEVEESAKTSNSPVYYFLTEEKGKPNRNETMGRIDSSSIKKLVPDVKEREVFLCGPAPFMNAIVASLTELGVKPDLIHFEEFSLH